MFAASSNKSFILDSWTSSLEFSGIKFSQSKSWRFPFDRITTVARTKHAQHTEVNILFRLTLKFKMSINQKKFVSYPSFSPT